MQINNINLCDECITKIKDTDAKNQKTNFEDALTSEVKRNISFENFVRNIETCHNAKIALYSERNYCSSIKGLNNVIIGGSTLEKMKKDNAFREKIMKVIDECCSYSAQQEIEKLSPPAKSAGVIIYPDGSYLCWIESIYSEGTHVKKDKNTADFLVRVVDNIKENQVVVVEQFNDFGIVLDNAINKKRSK